MLTMSENLMRLWRANMANGLENWAEPDGLLVPTEPDPVEREAIRRDLKVAIRVLDRILGPSHLGCEDDETPVRSIRGQDEARPTPPWAGCRVPPAGWWCSRDAGHEGPCAARPTGGNDEHSPGPPAARRSDDPAT